MKSLSTLFTGLVLVFSLHSRHKIILNVHSTVAFVRNGIEHSSKLSLFYNFHSFVFIPKHPVFWKCVITGRTFEPEIINYTIKNRTPEAT